MKYLKTYEQNNDNFELKIDVSLFPNHKGLEENETPTTGTWSTFIAANHNMSESDIEIEKAKPEVEKYNL